MPKYPYNLKIPADNERQANEVVAIMGAMFQDFGAEGIIELYNYSKTKIGKAAVKKFTVAEREKKSKKKTLI